MSFSKSLNQEEKSLVGISLTMKIWFCQETNYVTPEALLLCPSSDILCN